MSSTFLKAIAGPQSGSTSQERLLSIARPCGYKSSAHRGRRLRVLHVLPRLGIGGTEHNVFKIADGAEEAEFEHGFCAMRGVDPEINQLSKSVRDIFVAGEGTGFQFAIFRLMKIMRDYRPHIVHSRNWGAIEAVAAARLAGVPVVIHSEHGYELDMLAGLPLRRRLLRRGLYGMADVVFTVSEDLRVFHARQAWIPAERIRVIYNGVDTQRFAPRPAERCQMRQKLGFSSDTLVIGFVGRIVAIKDLPTLFRAVQVLLQKGISNLRLLVAGSGPELAACQHYAAGLPLLAGRVSFVGSCGNIDELLQGMDIFVIPSILEGMCNALLEAMASGLPVLATRVGGNPEVIQEGRCGLLFSAGNAEELVDQLLSLALQPQLRQQLAAAARQRAVEQFSLRQMLDNYYSLYRRLAAENGVAA